MYLWVSSMVGIICRTVAGEVKWLEGWQLKQLLQLRWLQQRVAVVGKLYGSSVCSFVCVVDQHVSLSFHTYRVRSGLLMGDVALGMKSASGAMNACIIFAASESRYFKFLNGDVWFHTVYVCMYACIQLYTTYMLLCIQGNCGSGSSLCSSGRHCHHLLLRQYLRRASRGSSPRSFLPLRKDPSSTRE